MYIATLKHSAVAFVLLLTGAESTGSTLRKVPLELSGADTAILWSSAATACRTAVREVQTGRSYYNGPQYRDFAVVYCAAHERYEGFDVARYLGCSRSNESDPWICDHELLLIEMQIDQRSVRVVLEYSTPRDALEVIGYLFDVPPLLSSTRV